MVANTDWTLGTLAESAIVPVVKQYTFADRKPFFLENLPEAVRGLMAKHEVVALTREDMLAIARNTKHHDRFDGDEPSLADIEGRVDLAVAKFKGGAFVRLGLRSPCGPCEVRLSDAFRVPNGAIALRFLCQAASIRTTNDLARCLSNDYCTSLFVFEWLDVKPWNEFRLFVRKGEWAGLSQRRNLDTKYTEITAVADTVYRNVRGWFEKKWKPLAVKTGAPYTSFASESLFHSCALDIHVDLGQQRYGGALTGSVEEVKVRLLSVHDVDADLCMFGKEGELDGRFRFRQ